MYDLFISYASEDKEEVARPMAEKLTSIGYKVWFDEFTLKLGDSLRKTIDHGLALSRFGIVILSPSFFEKSWPQYELDSLVQFELSKGKEIILPIWHGLNHADVCKYSASLANKVAATTSIGIEELCKKIREVVHIQLEQQKSEHFSEISDEKCPDCGENMHYYGFKGRDHGGEHPNYLECNKCGCFIPLL